MASRAVRAPWRDFLTGRRCAAAGLVVLGIIGVVVLWSLAPLGAWIWNFTSWIRELGSVGFLVFAALFVLAVLVMAPASALYMVAGLLYDVIWGLPIALAAGTAGSALQFLIARYLARERVLRLVQKQDEFQAVDQAVEDESWKVVLLLRLAPLVPGNTQGWLFGATRVPLIHFIWPTAVAIVPWALLFVGIGSAGAAALYRGESPLGPWQWALLGLGVVALAAIVRLISRRARARLERMGIDGVSRGAGDD